MKKCSQPQCKNVSRGKDVCVRHGHVLKKCNTNGCNNRAQRKGFCKTHGGGRICLVDGCSLAIFKGLKCNYHYNRPDVQCEVVVMDQPSIMSFDKHIVQNILQFAGGGIIGNGQLRLHVCARLGGLLWKIGYHRLGWRQCKVVVIVN